MRAILVLLTLAALAGLIYLYRGELSREAVLEFGGNLPAGWFIVFLLVLPLVGFPIGVFLLLAGVRFGFAGGMAVSAAGVIFHHLVAFRLAHGLFRARVRGFLERLGYGIPPIKAGHRARFTALLAIIRGPPYFAKLYGLALTDIPFRIYFRVGAPIYILLCAIPVGAGSAVTQFDATWVYVVLGILAMLPLIAYGVRRWMSARAG